MVWTGGAAGQTATGRGTAGPAAGSIVDITATGNVVSAVHLEIVGVGATTLSGTTTAANPTAAVGTLNFGSFSSLVPGLATNATFKGRTGTGAPGALIVGTLQATLRYNGSATGTVRVNRKNPVGGSPDVAFASLLIASPPLADWAGDWLTSAPVPKNVQVGYAICLKAGDATCMNGKAYLHDIAVFVPDNQANGPFSTVIRYVGTAP